MPRGRSTRPSWLSTLSSFQGLAEVFAAHGLPCGFYTDRASHYFHTPEAGGRVDKGKPTQVGRVLALLGIEHIAAYSPEARRRSERAFLTLQERLPKELALRGIATRAAANHFLAETFIPNYYACFAAAPEQPGSAFVAVAPEQWRDVLCTQEERTVGNDNTVRFNSLVLQIPPRPHYVRGQGPRPALPGRQPGRPPRSALPRPIAGPTETRSKTPHARGPRDTARRAQPVDLWTTLRLVHKSTGATSPTEPSTDVLHEPVNAIR